jgi:hypothetical protein
MMTTFIAWFGLGVSAALAALAQPRDRQPLDIFATMGLTPKQVAAIDEGRPVAKVVSWGGPSEVYVFGAVYVNGSPDAYLRTVRNVNGLAGVDGYLGIGELPANPTSADLARLTLEPDDVKALKNCREGACDLQLPAGSIQRFRESINWSHPDAAAEADALARGMLIELLDAYQRGGNEALGVYRDKEHPARVAEQFATMVGRASALPDVLPELRRYLLDYPAAQLEGADSFSYWEKVNFGMKPTIRLNHGVIYRSRAQGRDISAVAIKQLYATHYFHTALDFSVCVSNPAGSDRRGFYLLTLKGSEQDGLTGAKGSMLRKIVVDKTRSSLEGALASIKKSIEQSAPSSER